MKLGVLVGKPFQDSFKKLMNQPKIPMKVSFKLKGYAKKIAEEITKYNELRDNIAKEHSKKDESGKVIEELVNNQTVTHLDMGKIQDFYAKIKELDSVEVEFPGLSIAELGKEEDLTLVPDDVYNLEFLTE